MSQFDFRSIISYYIESEGNKISEHIIQLICEKLKLEHKMDNQLIAFYITCIIYCLWKEMTIYYEFLHFIEESLLKVISKVLNLDLEISS